MRANGKTLTDFFRAQGASEAVANEAATTFAQEIASGQPIKIGERTFPKSDVIQMLLIHGVSLEGLPITSRDLSSISSLNYEATVLGRMEASHQQHASYYQQKKKILESKFTELITQTQQQEQAAQRQAETVTAIEVLGYDPRQFVQEAISDFREGAAIINGEKAAGEELTRLKITEQEGKITVELPRYIYRHDSDVPSLSSENTAVMRFVADQDSPLYPILQQASGNPLPFLQQLVDSAAKLPKIMSLAEQQVRYAQSRARHEQGLVLLQPGEGDESAREIDQLATKQNTRSEIERLLVVEIESTLRSLERTMKDSQETVLVSPDYPRDYGSPQHLLSILLLRAQRESDGGLAQRAGVDQAACLAPYHPENFDESSLGDNLRVALDLYKGLKESGVTLPDLQNLSVEDLKPKRPAELLYMTEALTMPDGETMPLPTAQEIQKALGEHITSNENFDSLLKELQQAKKKQRLQALERDSNFDSLKSAIRDADDLRKKANNITIPEGGVLQRGAKKKAERERDDLLAQADQLPKKVAQDFLSSIDPADRQLLADATTSDLNRFAADGVVRLVGDEIRKLSRVRDESTITNNLDSQLDILRRGEHRFATKNGLPILLPYSRLVPDQKRLTVDWSSISSAEDLVGVVRAQATPQIESVVTELSEYVDQLLKYLKAGQAPRLDTTLSAVLSNEVVESVHGGGDSSRQKWADVVTIMINGKMADISTQGSSALDANSFGPTVRSMYNPSGGGTSPFSRNEFYIGAESLIAYAGRLVSDQVATRDISAVYNEDEKLATRIAQSLVLP